MNNSSQNLPEATTFVDRISNLPDELLCHILSFLDTKQAVATSILSKRWEFLWTYVDTLVLSNSSPNDGFFQTKEQQYMQFVRKVLELHRAPLIKRMDLIFHGLFHTKREDIDYVTWIQNVLFSKNIQSLHLCFPNMSHRKWRFCFFSSNTLVELRLGHADITKIIESPTTPFFPNLKTLVLYEVIVNTDSINRFIAGCSILEEFSLSCYEGDFVPEGCCISSATLKKLDIYSNTWISLNTPALEVLKIGEDTNLELLVESSIPSSLHEVHISTRLSELGELGFLKNFSNVSVLSLDVTKFTHYFKFDLPIHFYNLTKLEIIAPWTYLNLLRFFMEHSNNLQVITLEEATKYWVDVIWEKPQQVPMCLLSSLRTICIKDYGNEDMNLVIKYVLENAKVLEHMVIHIFQYYMVDKYKVRRIIREISNYRRASEICELSFL